MSFHFRVDQLFHKDALAIWVTNYNGNDALVAKPIELVFEPAPDGFRLPEPTIQMDSRKGFEMIQALLDALAENDFIQRKTKSQGQIEAMKQHLEDMREMNKRFLSIVESKL